MGSVNNAVRCGFICRLCSKIDKRVVHIYGELGRKYKLVQKIRDYLPIKVGEIIITISTVRRRSPGPRPLSFHLTIRHILMCSSNVQAFTAESRYPSECYWYGFFVFQRPPVLLNFIITFRNWCDEISVRV